MLKKIIKNISNLPGWRTDRKIIVIESDDWGSIRMPSLETFKILKERGLDVLCEEGLHYNQNDTLASANDLSLLFETLTKYKDINENHPIFTAISLVANPNFERIKKNQYKEYFWEPFTETLERYNMGDAFLLWKEGIQNKIFIPQFHGREHLNIAAWMRALQRKDTEVLIAYDQGIWGYNNKHPFGLTYQSAFDLELALDIEVQKEAIISGLKLFKELFGYEANFFVPPNGLFNNSLEKTAYEGGIKYMSASKIQQEVLGEGKTRRRFHYLGQKNKNGQLYITRNCFFEPSQPNKDWVDSCLKEIETAFKWKKPAIISTHRVNYIGTLNIENRSNGLEKLNELLKAILFKWPEVEFMSSNQLGDLININS